MLPARSLDDNALCGRDKYGNGTYYTTEGITKIVDMLKANTVLTSIRCVPLHLLLIMLAPPNPSALRPVDRDLFCLSIADNFICYEGEMSGLVALCKMLETNSSLLSLKYAPALHISVATMLLPPNVSSAEACGVSGRKGKSTS